MTPKEFFGIDPRDFKNLSIEEKKDFVHKVVTNKDNTIRTHCVLYSEESGITITLDDMIKAKGEEQAETMILDLLEKANYEADILDLGGLQDLVEKCAAGNATKEEEMMVKAILADKLKDKIADIHTEYISFFFKMSLDTIGYLQKESPIPVTIAQFIVAMSTAIIGSLVTSEDSSMHNDSFKEPDQIIPALSTIANDIEDCLNKHLWGDEDDRPSVEMQLAGLMTYLEKFTIQNESKFAWGNVKEIAKFFGMEGELLADNDYEDLEAKARETNNGNAESVNYSFSNKSDDTESTLSSIIEPNIYN